MKRRLLTLCILMLTLAVTAFAAAPEPAAALTLPPTIELYKGYIMLGLSVAFGLSEALSLIPGVKANGVFHGVYLTLGKLLGKEVQ